MFNPAPSLESRNASIDGLDRAAIAYLILPLVIFLVGWFKWWVAVPAVASVAFSLVPTMNKLDSGVTRSRFTRLQLVSAVVVGLAWTVLGGIGHFFFANPDWHIRDAVLHDLVLGSWPLGYGLEEGAESILRAPIAFYLPAALIGKWAGLYLAHLAMGVMTAIGSTLFLLQILSLVPSRPGPVLLVVIVIVLFSGLDIVGNLLNDGPRFRSDWNITTHLEWWAGKYQYSSMTTQLFWVPNHALGGWLTIGLLCRNEGRVDVDRLLPILLVALALWSPLTAVGAVPFVLLKVAQSAGRRKSFLIFRPRVWIPGLAVGLLVTAFLTLDPARIPRGFSTSGSGWNFIVDLLGQLQFFLLEAGFIGAALLVLHRSSQVVLALLVLAILPIVYLGPGNDLVMRASIPSLTVLAIGVCLALVKNTTSQFETRMKIVLGALLSIGSITAVDEIARALIVPAWPLNLKSTLIAADCGTYAPHYVARINDQWIARLMQDVRRIEIGDIGPASCDNPGHDLMWNWNIPQTLKTHRATPSTGAL